MGLPTSTKSVSVNVRMGIYFLTFPVILLYVLAITGCVSNSAGIPNIFLVSLHASNGPGLDSAGLADVEVRVGYFGLCAGTSPNFLCSTTPGASVDQLGAKLTGGGNTTSFGPLASASMKSLFSLAITLQNKIPLWLMAAAGCTFLIGLLFLVFLKRHLKSTNGSGAASRESFLRQTSLGVAWVSVALALAAAISTTQTTSALQFVTTSNQSPIVIEAGLAVQILQWLVCVLSIGFTFGITAMFRSRAASATSGTAMASLPPPPPPPRV